MAAVLWILAIVQFLASGWLLVTGYAVGFEGSYGWTHLVAGCILFASGGGSLGFAMVTWRLGRIINIIKNKTPETNTLLQDDKPYSVPPKKNSPPLAGFPPPLTPPASPFSKSNQNEGSLEDNGINLSIHPDPNPPASLLERVVSGRPEATIPHSNSTNNSKEDSPFPWIKTNPASSEEVTQVAGLDTKPLIEEPKENLIRPTLSVQSDKEVPAEIKPTEISHNRPRFDRPHAEVPIIPTPESTLSDLDMTTPIESVPVDLDIQANSAAIFSKTEDDKILSESSKVEETFLEQIMPDVDDIAIQVTESSPDPSLKAPENLPLEQPTEPDSVLSPTEDTKERVIVGQHEAGGNRYIMYDDGSIDAETSNGKFHFDSIDEMKTFIAQTSRSE